MSKQPGARRSQRILGGDKVDIVVVAKTAMTSFERLWGSIRVLDPDHPNREAYIEQFHSTLQGLLKQVDAIHLTVHPYTFTVEDQDVLTVDRPSENYIYRLYQDGIRRLTFIADIPLKEITQFIKILETVVAGGRNLEDDIVTLLWEAEFDYIEHENIEGFVAGSGEGQEDEGGSVVGTSVDVEDLMRYATAAVSVTEDDVDQGELVSRKKSFAGDDETLKKQAPELLAGVREDTQKSAEDVYRISENESRELLHRLGVDQENLGAKFAEIAYIALETIGDKVDKTIPRALGEFALICLDQGDFRPLLDALGALRQMAVGQVGEYIYDAMLSTVAQPELVECLLDSTGGDSYTADKAEMIKTIGSVCFDQLWERYTTTPYLDLRRNLKELVESQAEKQKVFLLKQLSLPEKDNALRALAALRKTDINPIEKHIALGLKHPDIDVRLEVLSMLRKTENNEIKKIFPMLLKDPAEEVRLAAISVLIRVYGPHIENHLLNLILEADFANKSPEEKKKTILALGRIAGENGMKLIRGFARGASSLKFDRHSRLAAITVLGSRGEADDLPFLEKMAKSLMAGREFKDAARAAVDNLRSGGAR